MRQKKEDEFVHLYLDQFLIVEVLVEEWLENTLFLLHVVVKVIEEVVNLLLQNIVGNSPKRDLEPQSLRYLETQRLRGPGIQRLRDSENQRPKNSVNQRPP